MNSYAGKLFESTGGAFLIACCMILRPLFHRWYSTWGTTDDEVTMTLPGDEYVARFRGGYTQAIDIRAPAQSVWPWIVQIGQDKGGYYSYELLENLAGCNIHNADRILPEFQELKPGDDLVMHPKAPKVPVVIVEPERALVYGGKQDQDTANVWVFYLEEKEGNTRLISRWSFDYKPALFNRIVYNGLIEPIAAVMQRRLLMGVKQRAEKLAASRSGTAPS